MIKEVGKVEENANLREKIIAFVNEEVLPGADQRFADAVFPTEIVKKMGEQGLLRIGIPREYGGYGRNCMDFTVLMEEMAKACASTAVSLIPTYQVRWALLEFGSEEQKDDYIPQLTDGSKISAFAVTEKGAGSDVRAMKTRATHVGEGYVLNGVKSYITNGAQADILLVLAQTEEAGISAFIVEKGAVGYSTGRGHNSFGLRGGPHVDLIFNDCYVPAKNLVGKEGEGIKVVLKTLNFSRVGASSISIGIARAALEGAIDYAKNRSLFGGKVTDLQGLRWRIAELSTRLEAAKLLRDQAALIHDRGGSAVQAASMAKLFATQVATEIALETIQIVGASAVMEGSPYKRYLLDAKAYQIAGGSSEVLLNTIAGFILGKPDGK